MFMRDIYDIDKDVRPDEMPWSFFEDTCFFLVEKQSSLVQRSLRAKVVANLNKMFRRFSGNWMVALYFD